MHIVYDAIWLYRSIACLILVFVFYKWNSKAQFVIPYTQAPLWTKIYNSILIVVVILCILMPLELQISHPWASNREPKYAIQVLFDVSLSMTAKDLEPSRFTVAKRFVSNLIVSLPTYQWSTLFFSGLPVLRTAYSHDTSAILQNIQPLSMWDFPPTEDFVGTAIGDALLLALGNIAYIQWDVRPFFILITDGDSNKWYDPEQILPTLKKLKIPVYTIGLWVGSTIIGTDTFGTNVYTNINLDLLKHIAKETWGKFFYVEDPDDFEDIAKDIQQFLTRHETTISSPILVWLNDYFSAILIVCLTYISLYRSYALLRKRSF